MVGSACLLLTTSAPRSTRDWGWTDGSCGSTTEEEAVGMVTEVDTDSGADWHSDLDWYSGLSAEVEVDRHADRDVDADRLEVESPHSPLTGTDSDRTNDMA